MLAKTSTKFLNIVMNTLEMELEKEYADPHVLKLFEHAGFVAIKKRPNNKVTNFFKLPISSSRGFLY